MATHKSVPLTADAQIAVIAPPVFDPPVFALRLLLHDKEGVPVPELPAEGEWFLLTRAQVERLMRVARQALHEADQLRE